MGTGAYKITDFSSLDHVTFERTIITGAKKPITKTQTWRIVPEARPARLCCKPGQTDVIFATLSESEVELFMGGTVSLFIVEPPRGGGPQTIMF